MVWKNGATENYLCTCFTHFLCRNDSGNINVITSAGACVKDVVVYLSDLLCLRIWESSTEKMNEESVCCF